MSFSRLPLRAVVLGVFLSAGFVTVPALASDTVTVAFPPNSHWAQEVDTVSRYDNSHDYSVAVPANQTLQINLLTRDPNVFFKVKDDTTGKDLVDTYKTGATTWSTPNAQAATYTIHVYVQPEAMQRDEKAKYALQIGRYGKSDLQPASTAVTFEGNSPWAQFAGAVDSAATAHDYTVKLDAGKTLAVNLVSKDSDLHFKVQDQADNKQLFDSAPTSATKWTTPVTAAGTYTVEVYVAPSAMPPGRKAGYTLQIGHYATSSGTPAPAGAGTAAQPAAATTVGASGAR